MPPPLERLYDGLATRDVQMLGSALHAQIVVVASAGMPLGVGGAHVGVERAIKDLWGVVYGSYDISPAPDSMWTTPDGVIVVHGWYRGFVRRTSEPVDAEFVHLLRLDDGLVIELRQITDTASWGRP